MSGREGAKEVIGILRWVWVFSLGMSVTISVVLGSHLVVIDNVSTGSTWQAWVGLIIFWSALLALCILGFIWRHRDPRVR